MQFHVHVLNHTRKHSCMCTHTTCNYGCMNVLPWSWRRKDRPDKETELHYNIHSRLTSTPHTGYTTHSLPHSLSLHGVLFYHVTTYNQTEYYCPNTYHIYSIWVQLCHTPILKPHTERTPTSYMYHCCTVAAARLAD